MATKRKSSVKWGELPPPRNVNRTQYDWDQVARDLRAKPNTWAVVFEDDRLSLVTAIRNGGIAALREEKGFEVRTRGNYIPDDGRPRRCDLWMRYVPEHDRGGE